MDSLEEKREKKLYAKFQDRILDQYAHLIFIIFTVFCFYPIAKKFSMGYPFLFLMIGEFVYVSYKLTYPVTFEQFKLNEYERQMNIAAGKILIFENKWWYLMIGFIIFTFIKSIK